MSYDVMFQKAIELQNAGALQQAEDIYQQLLQVMPENSDLWNLLGLLAQSKGELISARDCFLRAINYAPTPFFMHFFNLSLVYKSLNKNKEALDALQRSVTLKNDFAFGWQQLGILFAETGDVETGLKNLRKALEIDENFKDAEADFYFFSKQYELLFELADKIKDNYEVQYRAALAIDDIEQKETFLQRAILSASEYKEPLLLLANLKRTQNKNKEALNLYFKVLNLDNKNIEAILGVADIYLAEKKLDEAEKYYKRSFAITRDIAGAHINFGSLLYQQRRLAEALEEYKTAVALEPEKSEISYNLALILKETGDLEEALGLMFHAHLKEPENEIYAINIMETLIDLSHDNVELALNIAKNWQKNAPNNVFAKKILAILSGQLDETDDIFYAEHLFDNFAATYEETLIKLTPQIINKFSELYAPIHGRILDLGCGTGLAADKLKNSDNAFYGVDISAKMLAVAQKKNLYTELYKADVLSFLQTNKTNDYAYILAFDVLCYVGNLSHIFKLIKHGKIAFSFEAAEENRKENFYVATNGRYKHKASYIQQLLTDSGFTDIKSYPLVLRQENGVGVEGFLFVAECNSKINN